MLLEKHKEFLTSSSINNKQQKRMLKSDKIQQKSHEANIYDCKDMLSYLEKNLVSKTRYRKPKNRILKSDTSLIVKSSSKRKRKNILESQQLKFLIDQDPYYTSYSDSSDSDDELYNPEIKICRVMNNKHMTSKRTRKNTDKNRISLELSEVYKRLNIATQCSDIYKHVTSQPIQRKVNKLESNFLWIMQLKSNDVLEETTNQYEDNYLIILRNFERKLLCLSFEEFSNLDLGNIVDCSSCSVQITKRCMFGQLYVAQSLQSSVHFTLSSRSTEKMIDIFNKNNIMSTTMINKQVIDSERNFLAFYPFEKEEDYPFQKEITSYMISIGNEGLWKHFASNFDNTSQKRAKYVLNLGVTGLKCDCFKYISITGKVAPDLINKQTKTYSLDEEMITTIGKCTLEEMFYLFYQIELEELLR